MSPDGPDGGPPRADRAVVAAALAGLAGIGPFFEVDVPGDADPASTDRPRTRTKGDGRAEARPADAPGAGGEELAAPPVRLAELVHGGPELAAAIDHVRRQLGDGDGVERRVAASTLSLGHAARLWSVALGCWATSGIVPDLDPAATWVRPRPGAPVRLIVTRPTGRRAPTADDGAAALLTAVVETQLRPYFAALRSETRLAAGLLWGNAASALVGATRMLAAADRLTGRPEAAGAATGSATSSHGPRAELMAARLLAVPPLAGTTTHRCEPDGKLDPGSVIRRSCCLFYRIPGGGTCGDCPLFREVSPG